MKRLICVVLVLAMVLTFAPAVLASEEAFYDAEEIIIDEPVEKPTEEILEEPAGDGASGIPVNAANFPDVTFRSFVWEYCDSNGDGYLSDQERNAVTKLEVQELDIYSVKGIELFPNLSYLDCSNCHISSLELYHPRLEYVYCKNNGLTSLTIPSCPYLRRLECQNNKLTSLSLSGVASSFTYLDCHGNKLTNLNVNGAMSLKFLSCYGNNLTSLSLVDGSKLEVLDISENKITSIDISRCPTLIEVYQNGARTPLLNDGTNFYYFLSGDGTGSYNLTGSNGTKYKLIALFITDSNVTVKDGSAPAPAVSLTISANGKTAKASGSYSNLYARVALILDNNGVSGLYVTQVTINTDGTILIPEFMVPGLKVKGVNVSLVPALADIQSSTPNVRATASKML